MVVVVVEEEEEELQHFRYLIISGPAAENQLRYMISIIS
jgi:hypothetical protein